MNTLRDFIDKITSGGIPAWALAGVGIVLFLLAIKLAKGLLKFLLVVLALASLAGAVWWLFHNQGKI
jgi:hypothetical protein